MATAGEALRRIVAGGRLKEEEAFQLMSETLDGEVSPVVLAALLAALETRGEDVGELTGFARAMRQHAELVDVGSVERSSLVDTCGTGGDGAGTFNISTASAFVVAGAGLHVAKHGNRSLSSQCGSADVLEALGARVELSAQQAGQAIQDTGIGFLFAPKIHPAMRHAQPVRKELRMRTVFNILGPLTNPAGAGAQVVGVFSSRLVPKVAEVLGRLGVRHAIVVHAADGFDEVSTTGETMVAVSKDGAVVEQTWTPEDFGMERTSLSQLQGGDPTSNAAVLRSILAGEPGPKRDVVVVNAAAAILAAGAAATLLDAIEKAKNSIDSGEAQGKLDGFVAFTQRTLAA